jgi:hypothetical protein
MNIPSQIADPARFEEAIRKFDEENSRDPNLENVESRMVPRELIYAQWLTNWVLKLQPNASEELLLAARSQHICRWMHARDSYPMTRAGYLKWRENLKKFHARRAGEILADLGYPEETIARVQSLNLKENFPDDPESCVLEDALCLVFLERQLASLAARSTEEQMVNALRKAWQKMTPRGRAQALTIRYKPREAALIEKAIEKGEH